MSRLLFYLRRSTRAERKTIEMDIINKISQLIEPSLDDMGYRIVQVRLQERGRGKTLSIMAERLDGQVMSFDDCTDISRTVSALLDVEDPIQGAYNLEVMSPGIDRPLTRLSDYEQYSGFEAKIETLMPVQGRKRFRGILQGSEGQQVLMQMPEGAASIAFGNIKTAKLVLTDALMEAHLSKLGKRGQKKSTKQTA